MLGRDTHKNIHNIVSHDIGAAQLLPCLDRHSCKCSLPHSVLEEPTPSLLACSFGSEDCGDFFPFCNDQWVVNVAVSLNASEDIDCFLDSTNLCEPSWGSRKEWKTAHEEDCWYELDSPCCSEGSWTCDEAAAVSDEIHDEDAPFDGPLLDDDDRSSDVFLCDLDEVDGDLRGCNSNADAVDKTASDEHADAVTGGLEGGADKPEDAGKPDGIASSELVGDRSCHDSADDRSTGKGSSNAALGGAVGIVEVGDVLFGADNGTHGGDVEAEAGEVSIVWSDC